MSISTNNSSGKPRLRTELNDGREVAVEITGTPNNQCRVDVGVDQGRHWVFGVNGDVCVLLLTLNENGQRIGDELPYWIEPLIRRLGLEGIGE